MATSLKAFLDQAGVRFGTRIESTKTELEQVSIELRFVEIKVASSFSLVLRRGWKTSQIEFKADTFAAEVVNYLASQFVLQNEAVMARVAAASSAYSVCSILIDGLALGEASELRGHENHTVAFNAEVLTAESDLRFGIFSDREVTLFNFAIGLILSLLPTSARNYTNPDEVEGFPEGAVSRISVNRYERDPRNRQAAIATHGEKCLACDFDFAKSYGPIGQGYIVVHHIVPISKIDPSYKIDPTTDLITLCANCHAMIHRENPPMSLEELRSNLER